MAPVRVLLFCVSPHYNPFDGLQGQGSRILLLVIMTGSIVVCSWSIGSSIVSFTAIIIFVSKCVDMESNDPYNENRWQMTFLPICSCEYPLNSNNELTPLPNSKDQPQGCFGY